MTGADRIRWLLMTGLGTGRAPVASGTFGTLPAVAAAILLGAVVPPGALGPVLLGLAAVLFAFGAAQTGFVARAFGTDDPGAVVLDEIVGYFVTVGLFAAVVGPPDAWGHALAFVAFRVFDVLKPPPADRLEELHGALGIMADDVAAGVYAALVLLAAHAVGIVGPLG